MGAFNLEDFRDEVASNMDGTVSGNERVDRWINMAYFEIVGAVDFGEFYCDYGFSLTSGEGSVELPPGTLATRGLYNLTLKRPLRGTGPEDMNRRDPGRLGEPKLYARRGGSLVVWPTTNRDYNFRLLYIKEPSRLVERDDKTELPTTWDNAVVLLGTHYGHLSQGHDEKAMLWLQRALQFMGSRADREGRSYDFATLGVTAVRDQDDLLYLGME